MNWKYKVIIDWSKDDHVYVAAVPELPGCVAHSETQSIALKRTNEAIALWRHTAQEFGRVVPEPKGRR